MCWEHAKGSLGQHDSTPLHRGNDFYLRWAWPRSRAFEPDEFVIRDFCFWPLIHRHDASQRWPTQGGSDCRAFRRDVCWLPQPVDDAYDAYLETHTTEQWGGNKFPSLKDEKDACDVILHFAPETNGELAYRAYESESHKTGIEHTHLAKHARSVRTTFEDLCVQPRRTLTTPFWTGITNGQRTYSAYCQNIEERIPFRKLTGHQHLYLDHEAYVAFGEHLPTFKPRAELRVTCDLEKSPKNAGGLVLNYLTPHSKWHIHSTYGDTAGG
jgi:nitrate reductase alpha subunit